jgi:UDP-glucose 4-epimerase
MVESILAVAGSTIEPVVVDRRPGDPDAVVASVDHIHELLGWTSSRGLDDMVRSAWESHQYFATR